MNKYQVLLLINTRFADAIISHKCYTLKSAKAFAFNQDRVSPGIVNNYEIRKYPWWRYLIGNIEYIRYRYVHQVNDFVIVEKKKLEAGC